MMTFVRREMVQRLYYGFSILPPKQDVVQEFGTSQKISYIVPPPQEICRLYITINLSVDPDVFIP